jgi:hypothetical protein
MLSVQRSKFMDDLVALIFFLADGRGNVGFMRRTPEGPIHRGLRSGITLVEPPQQVLDSNEETDDRDYEP